jgi:hypothetical protein
MGKGRWRGTVIFGGEEGEEVRWLHDVGGRRHIEEWRGGLRGQRQRLTSGGWRWPKKIESMGQMRAWAELLLTEPMKKCSWVYEMSQEDSRRNTERTKWKKKKGNKIGNDFFIAEY